jgi:hypothetical protein
LVATECKDKKESTEGVPDHFEKMLKGPCSNHPYPIKHAYKDYGLMKKFMVGKSKKGDGKKKPDPRRTTPRRRTTMASRRRPAA